MTTRDENAIERFAALAPHSWSVDDYGEYLLVHDGPSAYFVEAEDVTTAALDAYDARQASPGVHAEDVPESTRDAARADGHADPLTWGW